MTYKTHLAGGTLLGLTSIGVLSAFNMDIGLSNQSILVSCSTIGALIPDIDHRGSFLGRRLKLTSFLASSLFEHRGPTHSPIIMSGFMFFLYFLSSLFFTIKGPVTYAFLGTYIGIISHILLDMITKGGVPLLYPITKKKFSLTKMKTGSMFENLILGVMITTIGFIVVNIKYLRRF